MIYHLRGYTIDADNGIIYGWKGKPITCVDVAGYVVVRRTNHVLYAHRLIWEAVHGPLTEGLVINHLNSIRTDNRIKNLELVTPLDNVRHAVETGRLDMKGEKHHNHKLNDAAVLFIRRNPNGLSRAQLASLFDVSYLTVWDAEKGNTWKHLPLD